MRMKHSFAIPYERIAEYCEKYPGRFHGLAGIDAVQDHGRAARA